MRFLYILIFLINTLGLLGQNSSKASAKNFVETFFEAFHKQDTTTLKSMAKGNIPMQSIGLTKEGTTKLTKSNYFEFLKNIASISKDKTFEEKLLGFDIKVEGNMANVWTPYEFWFDEKLSHCGVNSFQLMKEKGTWKLIYLVDTRERGTCKN